MTLRLPPPDYDSSKSKQSGRQAQGQRIPTIEDILDRLERLPGLVLMGMISIPVAKFYQQNLAIQLKALMQQPQVEGQSKLSMPALGEALRRDPSLSKFLEPFLTADEIAFLLRQHPDAPE